MRQCLLLAAMLTAGGARALDDANAVVAGLRASIEKVRDAGVRPATRTGPGAASTANQDAFRRLFDALAHPLEKDVRETFGRYSVVTRAVTNAVSCTLSTAAYEQRYQCSFADPIDAKGLFQRLSGAPSSGSADTRGNRSLTREIEGAVSCTETTRGESRLVQYSCAVQAR